MQHAIKSPAKKTSKTPSKKSTPTPEKSPKSAAERKADRQANAKTQPMLAVVQVADLEERKVLDTNTMSDQPDAKRSPDDG